MPAQEQATVFHSGECEIDLARREVRIRGSPAPMGRRAFDIFEILARSAGQLVSKNDLLDRIWPSQIVSDNTLQVHVAALRKALGPYRGMLKTESGRGYRLLGGWTVGESAIPPAVVARQNRAAQAQLPTSNLPAFTSPLIGRSAALQRVQDILSAYRVVTLTGPGGIGKSALALHSARAIMLEYADGVWLVELASLSDPNLVPSAVARIFGLNSDGPEITAEVIGRSIHQRNLLLILDNCEHIIDGAAELAETLLGLCPRITILATSREVLRIAGECVYRVAPLDVPIAESKPDDIRARSSVELFVRRCTEADSSWALHPNDWSSIAAICRQLDGIPLAIEFAAARAATLGVHTVAVGLADRFALLTAGRRTMLPRHQTLRAALDWSYELLPEAEQSLLGRLAVFAGGFTLEAAAAVAECDLTAASLVNGIANLVAKSFVVFDDSASPNRWKLLETIRAYGLRELAERGDDEQKARRLHASYFRKLFAPSSDTHRSWREDLTQHIREIDDVRAALDWSFSAAENIEVGIDLTAAYAQVWLYLSLVRECRECCERALLRCLSDSPSRLFQRLQLLTGLGSALILTMGPTEETLAVLTEALEVAEQLHDPDTEARILWSMVTAFGLRGQWARSRSAAERLTITAQDTGNPDIIAVANRLLGFSVLRSTGMTVEARTCFEKVLRWSASSEDQRRTVWSHSENRAIARGSLALVLCLQGFADQAQGEARAGLSEVRSDTQQLSFCRALSFGICRVALLTHDLVAADWSIAQLIEIATNSNALYWQVEGRFLQGRLLVERNEFANGLVVLRDAFEMCRRIGRYSYPEFEGALADAFAGIGQLSEALNVVQRALAGTGHSDAPTWYGPELHRIKGRLLLQQSPPQETSSLAEECFRTAAAMAGRQGSLLFELRAATDLARLRLAQDRRAEASDILAPVVARFTEGFATPDLRAARALLEASV